MVIITPLLVLGGGYWLLNSEWFFEKAVPAAVRILAKGVEVQDLRIGSQKFDWSGNFSAENITGQCLLANKDQVDIDLKRLKISHILNSVLRKESVLFDLKDLNLSSAFFKVHEASVVADVPATREGIEEINGDLRVSTVNVLGYEFSDVTSPISGGQNKVRWNDGQAEFYGGKVGWQILLDYDQGVAYSMDVKIGNVDLHQLKHANAAFFSEIQGHVFGSVQLRGQGQDIEALKIFLYIPGGGEVPADMLAALFDFISQTGAGQTLGPLQKELKLLAGKGVSVHLEKFRVSLESQSDKKLSAGLDLSSLKLNLDTHVSFDINVEGGWKNTSRVLQTIFQ
ncbi:MAG: hypothetical protein A2Y04_04510 [Omnitrophica WOR_2 bacterium GWC2_45_7]|nr:MAG: hypothetical protein A2Y04_04510 [Omnitrophica WOR_2 bacterium GWC2_45_7]